MQTGDATSMALAGDADAPASAWLLPGDTVLSWLTETAPGLLELTGITNGTADILTRVAASVLACSFVLLLAAAALRIARRIVDAVLRTAENLREGTAAALSSLRLRILSRRNRDGGRSTLDSISNERIELSTLEHAILVEGIRLPPGFALSVPDVAARLRKRPGEVQDGFDRLRRHDLVAAVLGSCDGHGNYRLTDSGVWYASIREQQNVTGARA